MHDICPLCGTERIGAFRFCRRCRFDFDAPGADPAVPFNRSPSTGAPAGARARTAAGRGPASGLLVLAFAIVAGATGLSTDAVPTLGLRSSAFSTPAATPATGLLVTDAPASTPRATGAAPANPAGGPIGRTTQAKVVRVIDASTILVSFGGRRHEVRYLGLTSPASVGRRAMAANAALVAGRTVVLEADVSQADRTGRLLRYVWVRQSSAWMLVNLELVRRGLARVSGQSPDRKYADRYAAAERHARDRHLGLWDHRPTAKPNPKATPKPPKPPKTRPAQGWSR